MTTAYADPQALDLVLPWQIDKEQEEKFKRWLKRVLVVLLVIFLIIPWLPVPDLEYEDKESDIVKTKIVLQPVIVEPEPTPVPVAPKPKPVTPPEPKPLQKKSEPKDTAPVVKEPKKRDIAKEQGLTAISSQLNSLRQSLDLTKLKKKNVSTSKGGKIARADSTVLGQDNLSQKSEGIVVDDDLMKNENIALAVHESTKLDGFVEAGNPSADSSNFYSDLKGRRSDESIRRVFEAGKSKAYMYYLRALRDNPGLAGTFLFEVVIEPNGRISDIKMVSSELNAPNLESKILNSVKGLNFGVEDVSPRKLKYKFNFLPS